VCGIIMPIMAMAYFFGQTMTYFQIQQELVMWATSLTQDRLLILLAMFAVLFVMGTFIDFVPNVVILAPLMMPVATEIGMDPVHFGIWFMFTLGIGFITPPYGFNLFVVSSVSGVSVPAIARRIMPFLIAMLITNVIIAAFPSLSLWILGR
jgi:TRAP-type C4-dicarboxylate transport system permease large subunit